MKLKQATILSAVAASLLFAASLYAQEAKPAGEPAAPTTKKSLMQQIKEGGWVMFPIGACSVLTLYLIVDGVVRTNPQRVLPKEHVDAVKNLFRQGDYPGAYSYCKGHPSPFTNVCRAAVGHLGDGKEVTEESMLAELAKENSKMQTYISYLSVIGVCTPMIGLLGTVTGMIGAFAVLGSSGIGDPSALSAKIGEVLIATASGLFIAIPAFGSFYYLRNRAAKALHDLQDTMAILLRKMPYELLADTHIGDEELFASPPNWVDDASGLAEPV